MCHPTIDTVQSALSQYLLQTIFGESLQHGDHLLMIRLIIQHLADSSCTSTSISLAREAVWTSKFIHDLKLNYI